LVSAVYRGDEAKPSVQTCTCVHRTCNRYSVTGDRYGVGQSHPRCDPCYTLNGSESEEDEDNDDDNNNDDNDEKNLLRHQQEYVFLLSISLQLLKFISDPLITLVRLSRPFFKIAAKQLGLLGSSLVEAWTNWGKSKSLCMQPPLFFRAV